jgi:hypothetical protein
MMQLMTVLKIAKAMWQVALVATSLLVIILRQILYVSVQQIHSGDIIITQPRRQYVKYNAKDIPPTFQLIAVRYTAGNYRIQDIHLA